MPLAGQELGTRTPLVLQIGSGFRSFRGMSQDPDPGSIGDVQFQYLQNIRHFSGMVIDRPGQAKDSLSTPGPSVYELVFDAGDVGAP